VIVSAPVFLSEPNANRVHYGEGYRIIDDLIEIYFNGYTVVTLPLPLPRYSDKSIPEISVNTTK
ncbi:hypothetical protein K7432_010751, partial [Basidiobolus ranarum]